MRTDDLINQLSSDLKPVRPQLSPFRFAVAFSFVCFIVICAGLMLVHVRSDWGSKFASLPFDLDLLFSLGLMLSALAVVGSLSSPGRGRGTVGLIACFTFVVGIFAFGFLRAGILELSDMLNGMGAAGVKCLLTVIGFSLLPSLVIGFTLLKRAPLRPKMIGVAMGLASIAAGTFAITLHCYVDNGMHIALWHFLLPIVVGIAAGLTFGAKSLKW